MTRAWEGHTYTLDWLSDVSLSVVCLDPTVVNGIDTTDWPTDAEVSAWCGRPVKFFDAGDASGDGIEAIFEIAGAVDNDADRD